jgi:hypothetical protein
MSLSRTVKDAIRKARAVSGEPGLNFVNDISYLAMWFDRLKGGTWPGPPLIPLNTYIRQSTRGIKPLSESFKA